MRRRSGPAAAIAVGLIGLVLTAAPAARAQVVRQLTDERTVSFGSAVMDDAGSAVWIGSSADPTGDNPAHAFRLVSIDPATGVSTPAFQAEGGISPLVSVSDDGRWVVFVSPADPLGTNRDRGPELWLVRDDGTGLVQLTDEPAPDGGSVSAVAIAGAGDPVIFAGNVDPLGTNPANVAQLFRIDRDGTGLAQITTFADTGLGAFAVSDDGTRLAFVHDDDLVAANPDLGPELFAILSDGTGLRQLTSVPLDADLGGATISGDGGTIAFTSNADLTGGNAVLQTEIFAIAWDGTLLRQVTTTTAIFGFTGDPASQAPSITDDGATIVYQSNYNTFASNFDGNFEIFRIGSDGTGQTALTSSLLDIGSLLPTVSGDGTRVTYLDVGNEIDLVTETIPGGAGTSLATSDLTLISEPDLTPDGTRVVFVRASGLFSGEDLWIAETDGSSNGPLATVGGVASPTITADGATAFFVSSSNPVGSNGDLSDELFRIETDGTGLTQLTSLPFGASIARASVADDGSIVVFDGSIDPFGTNTDGSTELFSIAPDGTGLAQLTDGPLDTASRRARLDGSGTWLVFESNADLDGGNVDGGYEVWRVRSDGSGLERLTGDPLLDARDPEIDGAGAKIVYRSAADPLGTNPEGNAEIFLYEPATATRTQVTAFAEGDAGGARIDRDGVWIHFSTNAPVFEDDPDRPGEAYRIPAAGGAIERVGGLAAGGLGAPALANGPAISVFGGLGDPTGDNDDQLPELWVVDRTLAPRIKVEPSFPTVLRWPVEAGPKRYDAIRGSTSSLGFLPGGEVDLGPVICLEDDSPDNDTEEGADPDVPAPGEVFYFLYRGSQGILDGPGSYGSGSAGGERTPGVGDCGS